LAALFGISGLKMKLGIISLKTIPKKIDDAPIPIQIKCSSTLKGVAFNETPPN